MRNKNYTIINIAGLAVGIAVCMIIFIIIQFQTSFDNFHSKKIASIVCLTEYHHADAADIFYGWVPFPMPKGLKAAFPQLEKIVPVYADNDDQILVLDNNGNTIKKFKEEKGVFFTEPSFFNIFDFPLLAGSYNSLQRSEQCFANKRNRRKIF